MLENVKINIKLTEKDIKEFSLAKTFWGFNKVLLSFFFAFCVLSLFLTFTELIFNNLKLSFIMAMSAFIFAALSTFQIIIIYRSEKRKFKNVLYLNELRCYEFLQDTILYRDSNHTISIEWNDIKKVQEFKPCYFLYISMNQYIIIPKRCFSSEVQFSEFLNLLHIKIKKNKLKLKEYKLKEMFPDYSKIESKESLLKAKKSEALVQVDFSPSKKEYIAATFYLCSKQCALYLFPIIGILLFYSCIRDLIINGISFHLSWLITFGIGAILIFGLPAIIYFQTAKHYEKDAKLRSMQTYCFNKDFYTIEDSIFYWNSLVKISETKAIYFLYISPRVAHIIPKRVFENRPEDLEKFKVILQTAFNK